MSALALSRRALRMPALQSSIRQPCLVRTPLRTFQSSALRSAEATMPVKKPVGAFRGGIFGFLFGSSAAGAAVYYYILEEYRVSNELLTEDIYALQAAVQRIEVYVRTLEEQLVEVKRKK